jgi:hypothetical protein
MEVLDRMRIQNGLWVVVGGFVLVAAIAVAAILTMQDAQQITAIVGSVTGLVGTVVGAYLGVQVGSAGSERAEMAVQHAGDTMTKMALSMEKMTPEEANKFMAGTPRG